MANNTVEHLAQTHRCTTWVIIRTFFAAAIAAGVIVYLCGCGPAGPLNKLMRSLIGAPSVEEISAAEQRLGDAERDVQELDGQLGLANAHIRQAKAAADAAIGRKDEIRRLYADMAAQLGSLQGAAADAMIQALGQLQQQLRLADEDRDEGLAVAAEYQAILASILGAQDTASRTVADARAQLAGFQDATARAVEGAVGGVRLAADAAAALGVPGANLVGEQLVGWTRTGLELLLGGGAVTGAVMTRRRKRERDGERERRMNLTRIVKAVDEFNLITSDEALRTLAEKWAGPAAHREMKLARAAEVAPVVADVAA